MPESLYEKIISGLSSGQIVPYLGPGVLHGSVNKTTGAAIPADSDSLILAMNNGTPMAPKLMYEFPRAAMNQELKRGRGYVTKFLTKLYGETEWTRAPFHDWLAEIKPPYVIDINRDTQLQQTYAAIPHTLIKGVARIAGTDYRFKLYHYDGAQYRSVELTDVDTSLPVLFKPMGTPLPEGTEYIASDADYVDYITELMGGFAVPDFLKQYRMGKQYLLLGLRLNRDTERMVMSDITYDSSDPRGWALIPNANAKEIRFCSKIGLEVIDADVEDLMSGSLPTGGTSAVSSIGC